MQKGDIIKFKAGLTWLYGKVDTVRDEVITVTYGTKKDFEKALKQGLELAPLIDVHKDELVVIEEYKVD